jgi:hypothetical protein
MFEHLPRITDDNYGVLVEKEAHAVFDKFDCVGDGIDDLREVAEYACREFAETNPNMMEAVYACAFVLSGELAGLGMPEKTANLCGILDMISMLTLLRLIDRHLEARALERKFRM